MTIPIRALVRLLGVIFLLLFPCLVWPATDVFKVVDPDGNVQYSDRPSSQGKPIKLPALSRDPELEQRMDLWKRYINAQDVELKERKESARETKKKKQVSAARCHQARRNLEQASTAQYLYKRDKNGEKHIFSFKEREQQIAQLRKEVDRICKRSPK